MEQAEENVPILQSMTLLPSKAVNLIQYPLWKEELEIARHVCRLCLKTFYNENALNNHRKMQHDDAEIEATNYWNQNQPSSTTIMPETQFDEINGYCGFKFIPLNASDLNLDSEDLTTKTFTEDTTYVIVKIEGDDINNDRERVEAIKKLPVKPKPAVDLRGPFTCTFPSILRPDTQCRQIFFNCCDYSMHYREDHTKRRKAALRCQVCEKRLDRDFFPRDSIAPVPPPPQTFSCHPCAQIFIDSGSYDEHNRNVHAKMKPHQCSICAKRFTQQGGLQQHLRMHSGIRPFACTFCPKAFTQKAGLDQHLRTHTKVKPFKCVICSKCFSQSVHLRQHMRTHTNIQPFACSICGRRFKQSSHLNFHMRSHIGDSRMLMENYTQDGQYESQYENHMEYLNLSNLQPVQDGDTLYYAAELAVAPTTVQVHPYLYQSQVIVPDNMLNM